MEFLLRNTHVVTAGVFKTKMRLKGKECSSELMELNIVCAPWKRRGEYGHEENSHNDDGTVVMYLKIAWNSKWEGDSFSQRNCPMGYLFFPIQYLSLEQNNMGLHHSHVKCCCKRVVLPD